jgi:hypothetical protein
MDASTTPSRSLPSDDVAVLPHAEQELQRVRALIDKHAPTPIAERQ